MGTVEKSVSLNLFYYILKFYNIWITCFKSLDFRVVPLPAWEFPQDKRLWVKKTNFNFLIAPRLENLDVEGM